MKTNRQEPMSHHFGHRSEDENWLALYSFYPQLVSRARAGGAGDDAEDVASTILIRIASRSNWPFEIDWPYLAVALRHELIDRHRRLVRDRDFAAGCYVFQQLPSSVEDEAISSVESQRLMDAIAATQSKRTLAMLGARITGMTWQEVASAFDTRVPTVQARVRRALIRMRRVLLAERRVA